VFEVILDIGKEIEKEITVTYQGCNQKGYCYTPIKKELVIKKSGIKINN
jgi:thiol:disulfide interchange protein